MNLTIRDMMNAHPLTTAVDQALTEACVREALRCAVACTSCADACLSHDSVADLRDCIVTCLNGADQCLATAQVLLRLSGQDQHYLLRAVVDACRVACATCVVECEEHQEVHDHCKHCASVCRSCANACRDLLDVLA